MPPGNSPEGEPPQFDQTAPDVGAPLFGRPYRLPSACPLSPQDCALGPVAAADQGHRARAVGVLRALSRGSSPRNAQASPPLAAGRHAGSPESSRRGSSRLSSPGCAWARVPATGVDPPVLRLPGREMIPIEGAEKGHFFAAGSFALGVLSAFRSPNAYWMPARKCASRGAFQKTGAPCPSEL